MPERDFELNKIGKVTIKKEEFETYDPTKYVHCGWYYWNHTEKPIKVKITFIGNGLVIISWQKPGGTIQWPYTPTVVGTYTQEIVVEPGMWVSPMVPVAATIDEIIVERVGWWKPYAYIGGAIAGLGAIIGVILATRKRKK